MTVMQVVNKYKLKDFDFEYVNLFDEYIHHPVLSKLVECEVRQFTINVDMQLVTFQLKTCGHLQPDDEDEE